MKYLYVTLYYFYTKIIFLHRQYPPIINISAVLSILLTMILMILVEVLNFNIFNSEESLYISFGVICFSMWYLFYQFYLPKEENILKDFKKKSKAFKILILIFGSLIIVSIAYVWYNRFDFFS